MTDLTLQKTGMTLTLLYNSDKSYDSINNSYISDGRFILECIGDLPPSRRDCCHAACFLAHLPDDRISRMTAA